RDPPDFALLNGPAIALADQLLKLLTIGTGVNHMSVSRGTNCFFTPHLPGGDLVSRRDFSRRRHHELSCLKIKPPASAKRYLIRYRFLPVQSCNLPRIHHCLRKKISHSRSPPCITQSHHSRRLAVTPVRDLRAEVLATTPHPSFPKA